MKNNWTCILIVLMLLAIPSFSINNGTAMNMPRAEVLSTDGIRIGHASIWGDGNQSILDAQVDNNVRIRLESENDILDFYIDYDITCDGITDEGIITLTSSLNGENISANFTQTPFSKNGTLYLQDVEVKRGDSILFIINVVYGSVLPFYHNDTKATGVAVFSKSDPVLYDNFPPYPPTISGPKSGKLGEIYTYQVTVSDPDEDDGLLKLEIDFGQGSLYEDCGCSSIWENGEVLEIPYKWTKTGEYGITARVMAVNGDWSDWSEPLVVSMPRSRPLQVLDIIPEKWDWRDVDGVDWTTSVKDQLQDLCGSCWAFGALGGLEAAVKLWNDIPDEDVDLSEQYLLSCSSGSCNGWYLSFALRWVKQNGMITEECFPYQADDTIPCESKCSDFREYLFGITGYTKVAKDVESIKEALVTYGPLPTSMTVYGDFYPDWGGGVYVQNSDELIFGHCVTIVGYDDTWGDEDEGYWICKNSWGTGWGEEGWFRIAYGQCDIESGVYYLEGPNYAPDRPSAPVGPVNGDPACSYNFSATGVDPEGDMIYYYFDWGDEDTSGWIGPVESGVSVSAEHSWVAKGTYDVKVKVRDVYGLESDWSDPLQVRMTKEKSFLISPVIERCIIRLSSFLSLFEF